MRRRRGLGQREGGLVSEVGAWSARRGLGQRVVVII